MRQFLLLLEMNKISYTCMNSEVLTIMLYEAFWGRKRLVIFGTGGVMETAFPPENIDHYLEHRGFVPLGRIEEVLKWTE